MRLSAKNGTGLSARSTAFAPRALAALCLCALLLLTGCSDNRPSAYNDAIDLFADGDYAAAAEAFDKLGDYQQAATYAAYARGLTYYGMEDYAAAEPYFEQTQDFMYGKKRYVYCHASVLQDAGSYAEAAEAFGSLGDFEDAPARAAYCDACRAEAEEDYATALDGFETAGEYGDAAIRLEGLESQVYAEAVAKYDAGEYVEALNLFGLLGDYFNSQTEARKAKDKVRDQLYSEAEQYEKNGDLQAAYEAFSGLSSYRDAQDRANTLAKQLGIDQTDEE